MPRRGNAAGPSAKRKVAEKVWPCTHWRTLQREFATEDLMPDFSTLTASLEAGIATLRLNRPDRVGEGRDGQRPLSPPAATR